MKRSVYARRRAFRNRNNRSGSKKSGWYLKLTVTVLACGFFIFIAAILLGKYLEKVSLGAGTDEEITSGYTEITEEPEPRKVPVIIGRAVTFNSVLEAGTDSGTDTGEEGRTPVSPSWNALSILLRYPSADEALRGTGMCLAYTSPVAVSESFDIRKDINLRDGIAAMRLSDSSLYISGVFFVSYPEFDGDAAQNDIREYEKKLVCELFEYGIDDVVLLGYGTSPGDVGEALKFAGEVIEQRNGSASVGVGIPFDFYSSQSAYDVMKANRNDRIFFALDLCTQEVPVLMKPEEVVYSKVNRIISLMITYNIRVVCGCGENPDGDLQASEAMRGGAVNVQGVKK